MDAPDPSGEQTGHPRQRYQTRVATSDNRPSAPANLPPPLRSRLRRAAWADADPSTQNSRPEWVMPFRNGPAACPPMPRPGPAPPNTTSSCRSAKGNGLNPPRQEVTPTSTRHRFSLRVRREYFVRHPIAVTTKNIFSTIVRSRIDLSGMHDHVVHENDLKLSGASGPSGRKERRNRASQSLVIGGTGVVGGYIVEHLLRVGQRPFVLSRSQRTAPGVDWFHGDWRTGFAEVSGVHDAVLHRRRRSAGERPSPAL